MSFNEYELVIIIRPDVDEAEVKALVEKVEGVITADGGHILYRDDWGQRKLAYAIGKHLKGHYFVIHNLAKAETIAEVERVIRITEGFIRFLTVRKDVAVDVDVRIKDAAEQARIREAEAKARAEAEALAAAEEADQDDLDDDDDDDHMSAGADAHL